jgi:hypothetical protein
MCNCGRSGYKISGNTDTTPCSRCLIMNSFKAALLFLVLAHPETYKITGGSVYIHALVFGLITYLIMLKSS